MRILVLNAGSSSLKVSVIGDGDDTLESVELGAPDNAATLSALTGRLNAWKPVDVVAHRIVHSGPHLRDTVIVDDRVRRLLDAAAELAPLHVPPALHILDLARSLLPVPQVACFDTSFHATLPAAAATYALPTRWREEYGVRRYGFHGLSCAWSLRRAAALLDTDARALDLLVAHLGSGASVTAIRDGVSVDTSMGFTPMEGLVMATRAGTIDPGALLWLQTARGVTASEMGDALEHRAGLTALAGTGDMRALLAAAAAGEESALLARDVYVHRARSLFAAMAASLRRLDAIVFTGGVGEHAAEIRSAICAGLRVLRVGTEAAGAGSGVDAVISPAGAPVALLVVHAREDLQMAREVRALLKKPYPPTAPRSVRIDRAR
jgi:acetate kinase